MFVLRVNGTPQQVIYKEGSNERESWENYRKKTLANKNILVIGGVGSGKTVLAVVLSDEHKENADAVVINLTEKPGSPLENAHSAFLPTKSYQLRKLKRMKRKPATRKAKYYAPFTFNIKDDIKKKMPPIKFITFSIKDIAPEGWNALLFAEQDKTVVRTCTSIAKNLPSSGTFWDLINDLALKVERKKDDMKFGDMNDPLGVAIHTSADKKAAEKARDSFESLLVDYFVQPENHEMNIDYKEMLNDPEHYHFITTEWIKDTRMKYFFYINFLAGLAEAVKECRHPVVVVLEEIKILLPTLSKYETGFEAELIKIISNLLSRLRSRNVTFIATTQIYKYTNPKVRDVFNCNILGKLSKGDLKIFRKDYGLRQDHLDLLNHLKVGEFVIMENLLDDVYNVIEVNVPPFAIAEEGNNFFKRFAKEYPEKCVTFEDVYRKMKAELDENIRKAKERKKLFVREVRDKTKAKKREKQERLDDKFDKQQKDTNEKELLKAKMAYEKRKDGSSWTEAAKEIRVKNHKTAKKKALIYAKSVNDTEFILKEKGKVDEPILEDKEDEVDIEETEDDFQDM